MFCPKCGTNLRDDAEFCSNCGTVVRTAGPAPGVPAAPAPPAPPYMQQETDGKAVASLVLGLLSFLLSFLTGIPAIILGHMSRGEIRRSGGRLKGDGMAVAGLVLGYISVAFIPVALIIAAIAIPNLMRSRMAANQAGAAATVRALITDEITYSVNYPRAGYAADLVTLGPGADTCPGTGTQKNACLIDSTLGCPAGTSGQWCVKDNYKFSIVGIGEQPGALTDFIITATPNDSTAGRMNFCAMSDGVVRFQHGSPVYQPVQAAAECQSWPAM